MLKRVTIGLLAAIFILVMCPLSVLAADRYEVLQIGDEDEWVRALQDKLHELGYLEAYPTGYFGTNTQTAVMRYQAENGLQSDGKAGPQTRQQLFGDEYTEIDSSRVIKNTLSDAEQSALNNTGEGTSATDTGKEGEESKSTYDAGTVISPGDKGDEISKIQTRLKELEYYDYGSITGYYGPVTQDSVTKFQRTNGLSVDGIMGNASLTLLYSEGAMYYTMYPGDSGDDIRNMQVRLAELGYFGTTATGYFGDITKEAVQAFQNANGLVVDGKVGKNTRRVLYSDEAVQGSVTPAAQQPSQTQEPAETTTPDASTQAEGGTSSPEETGQDTQAEEPQQVSAPSGDIQKLIDVASSQIGKAYSYGSSGPNSFDCSGFVYYVMKNAGFATSRLSSASYANLSSWASVDDVGSLSVGDLVFFKSDKSSVISHMGIYMGGGSFIHAAPSSGGVDITTMSSGYYQRNYVGAKRII